MRRLTFNPRYFFAKSRSIRLSAQLLLGLEEPEQIEAADEEAAERPDPATHKKRTANRSALAPHLPRIEMVVDIEKP